MLTKYAPYYIDSDLCETELLRLSKHHFAGYGDAMITTLITGGLRGLDFLHNIVLMLHCDLKPANLLICNHVIKIADFGMAIDRHDREKVFNCMGTPFYTPPEIWIQQAFTDKGDLFAYGATLLDAFDGWTPITQTREALFAWQEWNGNGDGKKALRGQALFRKHVSECFKSFVPVAPVGTRLSANVHLPAVVRAVVMMLLETNLHCRPTTRQALNAL